MSDTAKKFFDKLDELHKAGKFYGFSIWPTKGGYQVSLATSARNNWRIRRGDTPEDGIAQVLDMEFVDDELNPANDAYLAPPLVDEPPLPDEAHEDAEEPGIFD